MRPEKWTPLRGPARFFAILILMVSVAGCGQRSTPADGERLFTATIHPLKAILEELTGDRAAVEALLPPNTSPHTYDPKPSDVRLAQRSLALFYVDPTLDGWVAALRQSRLVAVLPMADPATLREAGEPHHHHDDDHDHDHSHENAEYLEGITLPDPHFWTDPLLVRDLLPSITAELIRHDPGGEDVYTANANEFAAELYALHEELAETLAPVRGNAVVLFHPSFVYMLDRYGLEYAGVIEPFPGREATPRYLQGLIDYFEENGIRAVFSEPQLSPRAAEVVSEGTGRPLFVLDPNGGVPGRETYAELMRYNAAVLLEALR